MKFLSKFFQEIGEHGTRTVVKYGTIMIADTLKRYIRLQHIIFTFIYLLSLTITILSIPSKLLEKAIHYQLMNYFEENNLLNSRQHGFRKDHSTSTAIHRLAKTIYDSYDQGLCTSCIFVDYKKAFETLDHDILLQKQQHCLDAFVSGE